MESNSREVDEKQKKTDERLDNYAKKKAEDVMDKFLQVTSSVGTPRDELIHRNNGRGRKRQVQATQ